MKLEVGMYVRTDKGFIQKILEIDKTLKYQNEDRLIINSEEWFLVESDLTKASHNIIDLIEVGDIVITPLGEIIQPYGGNIDELKDYWKITNNPVKSIITKEQFEMMSYKVVE